MVSCPVDGRLATCGGAQSTQTQAQKLLCRDILDKAPRITLRRVIWILDSYTVFAIQYLSIQPIYASENIEAPKLLCRDISL